MYKETPKFYYLIAEWKSPVGDCTTIPTEIFNDEKSAMEWAKNCCDVTKIFLEKNYNDKMKNLEFKELTFDGFRDYKGYLLTYTIDNKDYFYIVKVREEKHYEG